MPVTPLPTPPGPTSPGPAPTGSAPSAVVVAPPPGAPPALPARDLTVDLLRAVAMVAVAVGHWMVVVPSYDDGRFDGVNALATVPSLRPLTWVFQVMPLFFAVGGVANAASWSRARRSGDGYGAWLGARLGRLTRPAALLVACGAGAAALARLGGVPADVVEPVAWLVVVPVWFLAVYVLVVALAPAQWWAHERWGWAGPLVLTGGAVAVDALRIGGGLEVVGYLNFLCVFAVCQQLGFAWYDGGLLRRRVATGAGLLVGGLGALWLLTHVGPYPVSLVGFPGPEIANNAPPTITLIALGLAQVGAALLARPVLARALGWRPVQGFALAMNRNAMTILLWHFPALALAGLVLLPLGVVPEASGGSAAWWAIRAGTVVVLALVLAPLVALAGRVERRPAPSAPARATWAVVLAVPLLAVAFARITVLGLSGGGPLGLPVLSLVLFAAGTALLRATPRPRPTDGV